MEGWVGLDKNVVIFFVYLFDDDLYVRFKVVIDLGRRFYFLVF